jgi:hypothetical protein
MPVEFTKLFAFPIITYAEFIAAFALHALSERQHQTFEKPIDATMRMEWFKNTKLSSRSDRRNVRDRLLLARQPAEAEGHARLWRFRVFKGPPLFPINGNMYMLDYEFALGKLESAVIWRVLRNFPEKKKEPWLSYWGLVFEEYVTWMFETYSEATLHKLHPQFYIHWQHRPSLRSR